MRLKVIFSMLTIALNLFALEPDFGGYDGTAVIIDLNTSEKTVYGTHAYERVNPCSTFKILNSMIALDSGVVRDENETIPWDGKVREYPSWNRDHTMRSAIAVSAVWFYQELARRIGAKRIAQMVKKVDYGNADTSKTLTSFWLGGGSLKISPNEEAEFMRRLVNEKLPLSIRAMRVGKDIITLEKTPAMSFGGKTGSCSEIGWFVGYIKKDAGTQVFAFEIRGAKASGAKAKRIAMKYYNLGE